MTVSNVFMRNVHDITVPKGRRPLNEESMIALMDSIKTIGLQIPISYRLEGNDYRLVTGAHRLEAFRRLEYMQIPSVEFDGTATEAEIWEIDENLHRAELTHDERVEQIAKRLKLTWRRNKETKEREEGTRAEKAKERDKETDKKRKRKRRKPSSPGDSPHGVAEDQDAEEEPVKKGRTEDGLNEAAREMGVNRETARRVSLADGVSEEANALARELGISSTTVLAKAGAAGRAVARDAGMTNEAIQDMLYKYADEGIEDIKQQAVMRKMAEAEMASVRQQAEERATRKAKEAPPEAEEAPDEPEAHPEQPDPEEAPVSPAEALERIDAGQRLLDELVSLIPVEYWRELPRREREDRCRRAAEFADTLKRMGG